MRKLLKPQWLKEYIQIFRESGWKGVMNKGGIKLFIAFFLFFFIKGFVLYIIPLYIALQGVNSCGK